MKSGGLTPIILLIVIGGFFWFAVLRPQRKRQAETAAMQRTLAPGVEVMTTAGLYGTVVDIADDVVTLEVSPGVTHRYVRAAISKVLGDPAEQVPGDDQIEDEQTDYPEPAEDTEYEDTDSEYVDDEVEQDEPVAEDGHGKAGGTPDRRPRGDGTAPGPLGV